MEHPAETARQLASRWRADIASMPGDWTARLRYWRSTLGQLDDAQAPADFDKGRWQQLCDDAAWLVDIRGEYAARHEWLTADLFGLWPGKPHWGGIADRLSGSRCFGMNGGRARWRLFGIDEQYNRGAYPHLRAFWEPAT